MAVGREKKEGNERAPELKTEGPLSEKDEQAQTANRQRTLAEKALAQWRRLKANVNKSFNK